MRKACLISLLLLASALAPAMAATNVCGNIYDTWTKANSPYYVTCDLFVVGLTIEPGVKVIATGPYKIEVAGPLVAAGTAADSITFTSADSVASWRGLFFNYSAPGTLAFCEISKSTNHGVLIDNSDVTIHDCLIRNNTTANATSVHGGGIWTNMPLTLTNCTIRNNTISSGGAAYGGGVYSTKPLRLTSCVIGSNSAVGYGGYGGGVFCEDSISAYYSTIRENSCSTNSGACGGGGVYSRSAVRLFDTLLRRNGVSANADFGGQGYGGALFAQGSVLAERCRVDSNSVWTGGYSCHHAWAGGGGLYCGNGLDLVNTIVSDNGFSGCTPVYGGGVYLGTGIGTVLNCTIAYNGTSGVDAGVNTVAIRNSIVFFNASGGTQVARAGLDVKWCDVQGGYGAAADSNLNINPIFGSRTSLKIINGSPCIDRGYSRAPFNDACFTACANPSDPVCMNQAFGGARNDLGVGGGPFACAGSQLGPVAVDDAPAPANASLALRPNPSRGPVHIEFALPRGARTRVVVLDVMGREVARVSDAWYPAGRHEIAWDGATAQGRAPAGVYFVRLQSGAQTLNRRVALVP